MFNPISSVSNFFGWLKNQLILFAIFTPIFIIFKHFLSSMVDATAKNVDNFILSLLVRLFLPGIVGLGLAYIGIGLHCEALVKFSLFIAIAVGGVVTYGLLFLVNSFVVPVPFFFELSAVFLILIPLSLLENILPYFLPGLGFLLSITLSIIQLVVIYIYAGGQLGGIVECTASAISGKAIPGTGGVSIGA